MDDDPKFALWCALTNMDHPNRHFNKDETRQSTISRPRQFAHISPEHAKVKPSTFSIQASKDLHVESTEIVDSRLTKSLAGIAITGLNYKDNFVLEERKRKFKKTTTDEHSKTSVIKQRRHSADSKTIYQKGLTTRRFFTEKCPNDTDAFPDCEFVEFPEFDVIENRSTVLSDTFGKCINFNGGKKANKFALGSNFNPGMKLRRLNNRVVSIF